MSIASAHIQKHSICPDSHVEYFIKVVYLGKEWPLRKRFRDFSHFDHVLRSQNYILSVELPQKSWWNRLDPNFITNRVKTLQTDLNCLFCAPLSPENTLVREFLEVDFNSLALDRHGASINHRHFEDKDKLLSIVKATSLQLLSLETPRLMTSPKAAPYRDRRSWSFSSASGTHPNSNVAERAISSSAEGSRTRANSIFKLSSSWGSGTSKNSLNFQSKYLIEACLDPSVEATATQEWRLQQLSFDRMLYDLTSLAVRNPRGTERNYDRSSSAFSIEEDNKEGSEEVITHAIFKPLTSAIQRLEADAKYLRASILDAEKNSAIMLEKYLNEMIVERFETETSDSSSSTKSTTRSPNRGSLVKLEDRGDASLVGMSGASAHQTESQFKPFGKKSVSFRETPT